MHTDKPLYNCWLDSVYFKYYPRKTDELKIYNVKLKRRHICIISPNVIFDGACKRFLGNFLGHMTLSTVRAIKFYAADGKLPKARMPHCAYAFYRTYCSHDITGMEIK